MANSNMVLKKRLTVMSVCKSEEGMRGLSEESF